MLLIDKKDKKDLLILYKAKTSKANIYTKFNRLKCLSIKTNISKQIMLSYNMFLKTIMSSINRVKSKTIRRKRIKYIIIKAHKKS